MLTMTDEYHVQKEALSDELRDSSWCYRIPFDSGPGYMECGFRRNGAELFYAKDLDNNYYSTETIK